MVQHVSNIYCMIYIFLADKNDTTDAKNMEDTVDTFPFSFGKKSV